MSDIQVTNNERDNRYEAHIGGDLAGFLEYELNKLIISFTHTEVDPAFKGDGVGDALARAALDDVRGTGTRKVQPICPFIKSWIDKHPDYIPLVHAAPTSTAKE